MPSVHVRLHICAKRSIRTVHTLPKLRQTNRHALLLVPIKSTSSLSHSMNCLHVRLLPSLYHAPTYLGHRQAIYSLPTMEADFGHILPRNWDKLVQTWLDEDIPGFDVGGYVVGNKEETAVLYGKTDGVLAGRPFFDRVFELLDCKVCGGREFQPDLCLMFFFRHVLCVRTSAPNLFPPPVFGGSTGC